ncbi:MAG: response regulator transcription factor [Cephaloticoccus sp.]
MDSESRLRIVLADDHRVFAQSLELLLRAQRSVKMVHAYFSGGELLASDRTPLADVVLLDIRLPDIDGLECVEILRARHPRLAFLLMSGLPNHSTVARAAKLGVNGFVTKCCSFAELMKAIRAVSQGRSYYDLSIRSLSREVDAGVLGDQLSRRELEILRAVTQGCTSRQIAAELSISPRTVEKHRQNIRIKTRKTRAAQLAAHAVAQGLV